MKTRRDPGFGLVESVLSAAFLAVILLVALGVAQSSSNLSAVVSTLGHLQEKSRQTARFVTEEFRWSDPGAFLLTSENGCSRVDYRLATGADRDGVVWSSMITLRCVGSTVDSNSNGAGDDWDLVREQDGAARVVCRHVEAGGFAVTRSGSRVSTALTLAIAKAKQAPLRAPVTSDVTFRNGGL